jgi:hypothetical protein
MKLTDKAWIIAILIVSFIHFAMLLSSGPKYHEADVDQAWLDGYRAYQTDNHMPKPGHKSQLPGLKAKVQG